MLRASSLDGALSNQIAVEGEYAHTLTLSTTYSAAASLQVRQHAGDLPDVSTAAQLAGTEQVPGVYAMLRPGSDGSNLYISVHGFEYAGTVNATLIQPGVTPQSTSLSYSSATGTYSGTTALPTGQIGGTGTIQVLGVSANGRGVMLNNAFALHTVPGQQVLDLYSTDGMLHLHLPPAAFDSRTFVTITPLSMLPAEPPDDRVTVGSAYSAIPSGARTGADKPVVLVFRYDQRLLESMGVDPDALHIYRWKPDVDGSADGGTWEQLESSLLPNDRSVSATTRHFGIYALMGTRSPGTLYLPLIMR
ncbi:MAG: hypothetical protein HC884_04750 [Chloroflexaceae bacterium]|nr:hypothetical protein [Chloroflexaceae bacterium]